jgi:hypothetical protein
LAPISRVWCTMASFLVANDQRTLTPSSSSGLSTAACTVRSASRLVAGISNDADDRSSALPLTSIEASSGYWTAI